jgi:hypothetical protein
MGTLMRAVKATLLLLLIAAAASAQPARRRAIGWPFELVPCAPGMVAAAPGIVDFAVDGPFVYYGDFDGGIWRVPKAGGVVPTLLARNEGLEVLWIHVDATRIYFAAITGEVTADLYSMPKTGGAAVNVAIAIVTPGAFAADAQFIYWVSIGTFNEETLNSDGAVRRVAKSGGAVQTLVTGLSFPIAITVGGGNVYYGETGIAEGNPSAGLRRVPVDGGTVVKLLNGPPVGSIAVDAANAYVAVFRLGIGLLDIARVPLAGGAAVTIKGNLDFADGLVIHGGSLYFAVETSERTQIEAIDLATGASRLVKSTDLLLARLAFDECLIYYVHGFEAIGRAAQ